MSQDPRIVYPEPDNPASGVAVAISGDSPSADAFGRLRVSNPHVEFASTMLYDAQPMLWDDTTAGTGAIAAHDADRASVTLSTAGVFNDRAIRQSRRHPRYVPGQSQLIAMTFVAEDPDLVTIVHRSHVLGVTADTDYPQQPVGPVPGWNLDQMDGTGPSGVNLDFTKAQILIIDLQWLGVGRVRIGWDVDGVVVYCHELLNANTLASVYMSKAALPCRYEVYDNGASANLMQVGYFDDDNGIMVRLSWTSLAARSLEMICSAVVREGGEEDDFYPQSLPDYVSDTVGTNLTSLAAVRIRSGYEGARLRDFVASFVNTDTDIAYWELFIIRDADDPTFTGWANTDQASTKFPAASEYATDNLNVSAITDKRILASGLLPGAAGGNNGDVGSQGDAMRSLLEVNVDQAGASDILVLAAKMVTGTGLVYATLGWREVY